MPNPEQVNPPAATSGQRRPGGPAQPKATAGPGGTSSPTSPPGQPPSGGPAQSKTTAQPGGAGAAMPPPGQQSSDDAGPRTADASGTAADPGTAATPPSDRTLTVTIPLDRAMDMAMLPVAAAGRVLSAKGGLPVYVGLGVLAVVDVVDWPVAAAAGVGYAVFRRWTPFRTAHASPIAEHAERTGPTQP